MGEFPKNGAAEQVGVGGSNITENVPLHPGKICPHGMGLVGNN